MDATEELDEIRSAAEIARRALVLFAVIGLTAGAERDRVLQWLRDNDLWQWLTLREMEFIEDSAPSEKQANNMGWQCERLIVLVWSLGYIEQLPAPDLECDMSAFGAVLPPLAKVSVQEFISRARLRPEKELWEMSDELLGLHWEARDAKIKARPPRRPVDIEIAEERHHAINWVTGYCGGLPWDEVTTDT